MFCQKELDRKLRLLVDVRKNSNLITQEYTNNNQPVSTLSDATQHLPGKSFFREIDCCQAYHSLQIAEQLSLKRLGFNCACRTFVYKRLAQRISKAVSAISSFVRERLGPIVRADQCAQKVQEFGIAANFATDPTVDIGAVLECICDVRLELTVENCHHFTRRSLTTSSQFQNVFLTIGELEIPQIANGFTVGPGILKK